MKARFVGNTNREDNTVSLKLESGPNGEERWMHKGGDWVDIQPHEFYRINSGHVVELDRGTDTPEVAWEPTPPVAATWPASDSSDEED